MLRDHIACHFGCKAVSCCAIHLIQIHLCDNGNQTLAVSHTWRLDPDCKVYAGSIAIELSKYLLNPNVEVELWCRYVQQYDSNNPRTFKGNDLTKMSMKELFDSFGLEVQTIDFVGHAIALHRSRSGSTYLFACCTQVLKASPFGLPTQFCCA